jgi:hypothetical protein
MNSPKSTLKLTNVEVVEILDIGDIFRISREDALEILGSGSEGTELPLQILSELPWLQSLYARHVVEWVY